MSIPFLRAAPLESRALLIRNPARDYAVGADITCVYSAANRPLKAINKSYFPGEGSMCGMTRPKLSCVEPHEIGELAGGFHAVRSFTWRTKMKRGICSFIALMVAAPGLAMAFDEDASYNQCVLQSLKGVRALS